jgi:crotonobetainyl-CoA:carnitine CoA-transferase CaiB-like acyl-CoA transferase
MSSAHLLSYFYTEYWMEGTVRKPMGTANHLSVPNQVFPTSDGGVVIIAPNDEMWQRCVDALGDPSLGRPEFRTVLERLRRRDELVEAVSQVTRRMTSREAVQRLGAVKVNVAKVNTVGEAADDPQIATIGGIVEFESDGRPVKAVATPFNMSGTPLTVDRPPPGLGTETDEILRDLGFGADDVTALREQGAFGANKAKRSA